MEEKERNEQEQYEEISLLDLMIIFAKGKKTIIATTILFIALGFGYTFTFGKPVMYRSNLQMMLITPSIVSENELGLSVSNSFVNAVISSDAVKDAVIDKFDLDKMKKGEEKGFNMEVKTDDTTGVITLGVSAPSAEQAREIATFVFEMTDNKIKEMANVSVDLVDSVNAAKLEHKLKDNMSMDAKGSVTMLKLYDALVAKYESERLRGKLPMALQLLSPASLPDAAEPRGRAKTVVLFTMLGFFLGLVLAFMKYVWSTVEPEKKQQFFAALKQSK